MRICIKDADEKIYPISPVIDVDGEEGKVLIIKTEKQEPIFLMWITPELAQIFLDNQIEKNRNASPSVVERYKRDILDDKWEWNARNLIQFKNGVMYNGQHRCLAIVASGKPALCWIHCTNDEIPRNIDNGSTRTPTNIFNMNGKVGKAYETFGVALCRFGYSYINSTTNLSIGDIEQFIDQNNYDICQALEISGASGSAVVKSSGKVTCRRAAVQFAIFCALKAKVSPELLRDFCTVANEGFMRESWQMPAILLMRYVNSSEAKANGTAVKKKLCNVAQEAIYDFVHKNERKKMYSGERSYYSNVYKKMLEKETEK